jgi:hypothetical protein
VFNASFASETRYKYNKALRNDEAKSCCNWAFFVKTMSGPIALNTLMSISSGILWW